jgi:hypothetical protein
MWNQYIFKSFKAWKKLKQSQNTKIGHKLFLKLFKIDPNKDKKEGLKGLSLDTHIADNNHNNCTDSVNKSMSSM